MTLATKSDVAIRFGEFIPSGGLVAFIENMAEPSGATSILDAILRYRVIRLDECNADFEARARLAADAEDMALDEMAEKAGVARRTAERMRSAMEDVIRANWTMRGRGGASRVS